MRVAELELTWTEHLAELRRRLLVSLAAWAAATAGAWFGADRIVTWLLDPAVRAGVRLFMLTPADALVARLTVALTTGVILAAPVLLYQLAAFTWPGLERRERWLLLGALPSALLLFAGGVVFGYTFLLEDVLRFLLSFTGSQVETTLPLHSYIAFLTGFLAPFGLAFQLPVAAALLARFGLITGDWLSSHRRHSLLLIVVAAALLTPPDPLSQIALSIPLIGLYEVSIWVARLFGPRRKAKLSRAEVA